MIMKNSLLISRSGTTLVEVMIALIIIAIVIMGGGMFFFYGRVIIIREAHRRAAVMVASERLEELKGADWDSIADLSYQTYYITYGSDWTKSQTEAKDTGVPVDNLSDGEMITKAQWKPVGSQDYLEITVTINWVDSRSNSVSSTTLIAPR